MNYKNLLFIIVLTACGNKDKSNDTSSSSSISTQNFSGQKVRTVYYSQSPCVTGFIDVGYYWSGDQRHNTCLQE